MRAKGTCTVCGKKLPKRRRKYCSDKCSYNWNYKKSTVWDLFRSNYLHDSAYSKKKTSWGGYINYKWRCAKCKNILAIENNVEVDHIIAIVLGGHPWHKKNLQTLCSKCHRVKTSSDVRILAWWRKESKFDPTLIPQDNQTLLEEYIETPTVNQA